jgi:AbrB family looped-hinge helix DNA binding protein
MLTTIDKAGRIVVPVEIRRRFGLEAGTEIEIVVEGSGIRLAKAVAGPEVVRRSGRLLARPRAPQENRVAVDVARFVEEERDRWPR